MKYAFWWQKPEDGEWVFKHLEMSEEDFKNIEDSVHWYTKQRMVWAWLYPHTLGDGVALLRVVSECPTDEQLKEIEEKERDFMLSERGDNAKAHLG